MAVAACLQQQAAFSSTAHWRLQPDEHTHAPRACLPVAPFCWQQCFWAVTVEHSAGAEGRQLPAGLCYAPAHVCSSFAFIHLQCRGSTHARTCARLSWPQALFGMHHLSLSSSFWWAVFSIPHFLLSSDSNRTGFCPPPPNVALPCCTMQRKQARFSSCKGIQHHCARAWPGCSCCSGSAAGFHGSPLRGLCLLCGTQQTGS